MPDADAPDSCSELEARPWEAAEGVEDGLGVTVWGDAEARGIVLVSRSVARGRVLRRRAWGSEEEEEEGEGGEGLSEGGMAWGGCRFEADSAARSQASRDLWSTGHLSSEDMMAAASIGEAERAGCEGIAGVLAVVSRGVSTRWTKLRWSSNYC